MWAATLICAATLGVDAEPKPQIYRSPYSLSDAPRYYRSMNPTTNTHETTHGVNSMLRQQYGGACFYIGEKKFVRTEMLRRPTLGQIAQRVRYRGDIAQLYLEQQRYPLTPQQIGPGQYIDGHEHDPLTLFDELSAYANGAAIDATTESELRFAMEMAHYSATVVFHSPADYGGRVELARIWCFFARRIDKLGRRARATGRHYDRRQDGWLAQLQRDYQRIAPIAKRTTPTTTPTTTKPRQSPARPRTQSPAIRYRAPNPGATAPDT